MSMKKGFASEVHGQGKKLFKAAGAMMGKVIQNTDAAFKGFACLAKGDVAGYQRETPKALQKLVEQGARMLGIPFANAAESPEEKLRLAQNKRRGPTRAGPKLAPA